MKNRYDEGGAVETEEGAGGYGALPEPESVKPKSFKEAFAEARSAGEKTFTWNGKKFSTEIAGAAKSGASASPVSGRPRGESIKESERSSNVPDERARLAARFGTAEQRAKYSKDQMISQSDIDRAKAEGAARRARIEKQGEDFSRARNNALKRFGTQSMRDEAQGYAKGGSVRGGGCEQRGKTKGRFV